MSIEARDLTPQQQQLVACALNAASAALESGEWPDLSGATVGGTGVGVAALLVNLAGQLGSAKRVTYYTGYGDDA